MGCRILKNDDIKVGLIGAGRWGKNIINTIANMENIKISKVATSNRICLLDIDSDINYTNDWREVCNDKSIDAIIVASPPNTHFEISSMAIRNGLPVLVEKPFTTSLYEALELQEFASKKQNLCMVNYIHLYSESYIKLKNDINKFNDKINSIESIGLSNGPFRNDISVLWDWGSHEIAFCVDLLGIDFEISKFERLDYNKNINNAENLTITLNYGNLNVAKCIFGNVNINKTRTLKVKCDNSTYIYNGLEGSLRIISNNNSINSIINEKKMPLECVIDDFIMHINKGESNHFSLDLSCQVSEILENLNSFKL